MAIEVRWIAGGAASSLHAAAAMLGGAALVDARVAAELGVEAEGLRGDLATIGLDQRPFFEHAIPLSARFDAPLEWAKATLAKALGPDQPPEAAGRLSRRLIALGAALERAHTRALEELELRADPLRQQWEARGPGLMAELATLTEDDLVVAAADVILVHPVQGGGGAAHWLYNSVRIEAVLANPLAELPEVVRLGWLLAQLNLDLPKFEGDLRRDRAAVIGPIAMIPPVLAAAAQVELAQLDVPTLGTALAAWRIDQVEPAALLDWWEAYLASRASWTVALGALDRMLSP